MITLSSAHMAQAADRYWKGGGSDTLWSTQANWKDSVVPTSSDNAHFRADQVTGGFSGKTVTLRDSYSVKVLHVSEGSSEESPIVFEADQNSAHGLTFTDDGWLGYYANGALWLKSGTYTFAKSLRIGVNVNNNGNYSGDKNSFCLKVGDGVSPVVLNARGNYGPILGSSSKLIADKATLDFTGKSFNMYSTSSVNIKDSTMMANYFYLAVNENNNCTADFNAGSLDVLRDFNVGQGSRSVGTLTINGGRVTCNEGGDNVFNIGYGQNSMGKVVISKGDVSCKYLRLGSGSQSKGEFSLNAGSLVVLKDLNVGQGNSSEGTLTINGGRVTCNEVGYTVFNIGYGQDSKGTVVLDKGDVTCKYLRLGNASGAEGRLTQNGGTLTVKGVRLILALDILALVILR